MPLSPDEIARRSSQPRDILRAVLAEEVRRGRVARADDGSLALVVAAFRRRTLSALQGLSRPDVAELASGYASHANGSGRPSAAEWWNISQPYY